MKEKVIRKIVFGNTVFDIYACNENDEFLITFFEANVATRLKRLEDVYNALEAHNAPIKLINQAKKALQNLSESEFADEYPDTGSGGGSGSGGTGSGAAGSGSGTGAGTGGAGTGTTGNTGGGAGGAGTGTGARTGI